MINLIFIDQAYDTFDAVKWGFNKQLDQCIMTQHGIVPRKSAATLLPGEEVDDRAVHLMFIQLIQYANQMQQPIKYVLMDPLFLNILKENDENVIMGQYTREDILEFDYIVIPANIDNVHWVLFMVNLKGQRMKIVYYDSLSWDHQESLVLVKRWLGWIMTWLPEYEFNDIDVDRGDSAQQPDNKNCALYVMGNFMIKIKLLTSNEVKHNNMPVIRDYALKAIMTGSLDHIINRGSGSGIT